MSVIPPPPPASSPTPVADPAQGSAAAVGDTTLDRYRHLELDELPPHLQAVLEEYPNNRNGSPIPPWRVQPFPPHPQNDTQIDLKARRKYPGDVNEYGQVVLWPDLTDYPEPPENLPVCDRCKLVHYTRTGLPSCSVHNNLGLPCRRPTSAPSHVGGACYNHGTTAHRKHSRRMLAEKELRDTIRDVEVEPIGNPLDRLAELAAEQLAWKDHLASTVAELYDRFRFTDDKGAEQLDARVDLYTKAMKETQRQLDRLVAIGFEEQRLRLEERRAQLVVEFVTLLLDALGHKIDDPPVKTALERYLPMLDGNRPDDPIPVAPVDEDEDEDDD